VNVRKILCATDFSEHSYRALDLAVSMAKDFGAELILLHVVADAMINDAIVAEDQPMRAYLAESEGRLDAHLDRLIQERTGSELKVEKVLTRGTPHRKIVAVAREKGADLIVLATHGRGPVEQFFIGSTAEQVVRHAGCSVLTVRE